MKKLSLLLLPILIIGGCARAQTADAPPTPKAAPAKDKLAENDAELTQIVSYDGVPLLKDITFKPISDPLPTTGTVLFVSPQGQKNAPGTLAAPLLLGAAVEKAPEGATLVCAAANIAA